MNSETVDLIATDPPFNKGVKAFTGIVAAGEGKEGRRVSYKDTWTWGDVQAEWTETIKDNHPNLYAVIQAANVAAGEDMGAFLCWLAVRVLEMHRILKPTGSMYLHVDHTAHAYVKAMMDAVFGRRHFRNEIVWGYRTQGVAMRWWPRKHDTLLLYTKGDDWTFHSQMERQVYGKPFRHTQVDADGNYYVDTYLRDVWDNDETRPKISQSKERMKYPTQKPLALYERIITASSNAGDIVLDPYAGCATTCVAAERLGRRWIGIDLNEPAEDVLLDRLQRETQASMAWNDTVSVHRDPPLRTDDGAAAAPELVLVSPKPQGPRMTIRELRGKLVLEDGGFCQGCGYVPPNGLAEYLEVDHKQPKSRQGQDGIRNRVLLCSPCNGVKGNKLTLAELRLKRIQEGRMLNKSWTMDWYEHYGKFA